MMDKCRVNLTPHLFHKYLMYVERDLCLFRATAFALAIVSHQKPCRSVVEGYEVIQLHWLHDISINTLIHSCFILTINIF